jgi:hypothetical protein
MAALIFMPDLSSPSPFLLPSGEDSCFPSFISLSVVVSVCVRSNTLSFSLSRFSFLFSLLFTSTEQGLDIQKTFIRRAIVPFQSIHEQEKEEAGF